MADVNGVLYIGSVKWNDDYLNVCDFGKDISKRNSFFKNNFKKVNAKILAINPNGICKIGEKLENVENYNYIFYQNDSKISKTYFCSFIKSWEIGSENVTILNLKQDVFQQYYYDTVFYKSFIKRGHPSSDSVGDWVAPEPVGFPSKVEKNLTAFSDIDFSPDIYIDSNSVPTSIWSGEGTPTVNFKYGGGFDGTAAGMCGFFRCKLFSLTSENLLNRVIHTWGFSETTDTTVNHYSDLIGYTFLPSWVSDSASFSQADPLNILHYVNSNAYATISDTVSLDKNTLACGYSPRNKKMLTSVAKCYKLYNKNGLSIPLQPELLGNLSSLTLKISMRPMGSQQKFEISNYKDLSARWFNVPYSFSAPMGFNSNVGVAQQTALQQLENQVAVTKVSQVTTGINTVASAIGGVGQGAMQIAVGDYGGGASTLLGTALNTGTSIANQVVQNRAMNFNNQVTGNDLVNSIGKSIGSSNDRTDMSNDFCKIRIADCSPLHKECEILDDFFDMYGYEIDELRNPRQWVDNRPKWNYLKTENCNLHIPAPTDYENVMKSIFNNGVTLWHDYSTFGDYSQNNLPS